MAPAALRLPLLSTLMCSVNAPLWAEVITGASFVPMTVIVTGWVEQTPLGSLTVMLYLMERAGRGGRKWRAPPALKVKATEPDPDPVSATVAESAPARTASIPLGGVTPSGQLVEVTL